MVVEMIEKAVVQMMEEMSATPKEENSIQKSRFLHLILVYEEVEGEVQQTINDGDYPTVGEFAGNHLRPVKNQK